MTTFAEMLPSPPSHPVPSLLLLPLQSYPPHYKNMGTAASLSLELMPQNLWHPSPSWRSPTFSPAT